jgi:DNA-binding NarL/FixJ family response regulator
MMRRMPDRKLIVDDHAAFRRVARRLLQETRRLKPDLVLLDIQLPGLDPFAVSSRDAADYGPGLDGCGALGFGAKVELRA